MPTMCCKTALACASLFMFAPLAAAQAEPFGGLERDAQTARNVWDAALVSSSLVAQQMQEALANAPPAGPERAVYLWTWACLLDAAMSPVVIDLETAVATCGLWAQASAAHALRPSAKTPYSNGSQTSQTVWQTFQKLEAQLRRTWPKASETQIFSIAVCAADAARAFGVEHGLDAPHLQACARSVGLLEQAPAKRPVRMPAPAKRRERATRQKQ